MTDEVDTGHRTDGRGRRSPNGAAWSGSSSTHDSASSRSATTRVVFTGDLWHSSHRPAICWIPSPCSGFPTSELRILRPISAISRQRASMPPGGAARAAEGSHVHCIDDGASTFRAASPRVRRLSPWPPAVHRGAESSGQRWRALLAAHIHQVERWHLRGSLVHCVHLRLASRARTVCGVRACQGAPPIPRFRGRCPRFRLLRQPVGPSTPRFMAPRGDQDAPGLRSVGPGQALGGRTRRCRLRTGAGGRGSQRGPHRAHAGEGDRVGPHRGAGPGPRAGGKARFSREDEHFATARPAADGAGDVTDGAA